MDLNQPQYRAGDVVYVIYRNPHTFNVANVQEAAVVKDPEEPGELALFLYDTYFPLDSDIAVYASLGEAERAYEEAFGTIDLEGPQW
ncbi:transcriptional regulator [Halobacillus salinarum]|uniref:Transcriptional regulator n=1 Tax=Halobacillus salinarum TaxID=2932257 RepID=A0ABY4EJV3_9BACI|nr:transcriptional regulator SplA domain-containing protein [Halobacillus salinarum]UOQ44754.1 transcriptional regulator [Halobacillus salinarum]